MERIPIIRQLLLAEPFRGLMIGYGGDKGTKTPKNDNKKAGGVSGGKGAPKTSGGHLDVSD